MSRPADPRGRIRAALAAAGLGAAAAGPGPAGYYVARPAAPGVCCVLWLPAVPTEATWAALNAERTAALHTYRTILLAAGFTVAALPAGNVPCLVVRETLPPKEI